MIVSLAATVALVTLIVILLWRRWRRPADQFVVMEAWLVNFSTDAYRPMVRLGERHDTGFIASKRSPAAARRYRRVQRKILKDYLRSLSRDYHRLHSLALDGERDAGHARHNAAMARIDEKMEFIFSMWSVELRMAMDQIAPCTVNLRPLLVNVEQLAAKAREESRRRLEFRIS